MCACDVADVSVAALASFGTAPLLHELGHAAEMRRSSAASHHIARVTGRVIERQPADGTVLGWRKRTGWVVEREIHIHRDEPPSLAAVWITPLRARKR